MDTLYVLFYLMIHYKMVNHGYSIQMRKLNLRDLVLFTFRCLMVSELLICPLHPNGVRVFPASEALMPQNFGVNLIHVFAVHNPAGGSFLDGLHGVVV